MSYAVRMKNGTVADGTGAPRYRADGAVAGGQIVGRSLCGAEGKNTAAAGCRACSS